MKIAHFVPSQGAIKKDILFCNYLDAEFVRGDFTGEEEFIYAGSVSVLAKAIKMKNELNVPLACWVWDIAYNWREWGMDSIGLQANRHRDGLNSNYVRMLRACDLVISASQWTQNVLYKLGIDSQQIYFYINTDGLDAIPEQKKEKQVIQISRYFYNKRFEDSIRAMEAFPDYKLVLMGTGLGGAYGQYLTDIAGPNVKFYNNAKRNVVITELKKSELLLSPSVFEGWGITPIEAIYCGVPAILSDLQVFKEVYKDIGIFHNRTEVQSLMETIAEYIGNPTKQQAFIEKARPLVADFTPERFAERWKNLINKTFRDMEPINLL